MSALSSVVATPTVTVVSTAPEASASGSLNAWTTRLGGRLDRGGVRGIADEQRELIAAEPRGGVARRGSGRNSRTAVATSSSSPTPWPIVSFTTLKSSRSTNSTPAVAPSRRAAATCCEIRSWKSSRLGSPVSASWKAWCLSCSSSWRCSVTSRKVSTRPATVGSSRRSLALTWTWTAMPSRRLIRRST